MLRSVLPFTLAGVLALSFSVVKPGVASAKEYNFAKYASKKGCASIVFSSRRSDCHRRQSTKNTTCRNRLVCDYNKAEKVKKDYKDKTSKLGSANKSDKKHLEAAISRLKTQLDRMKTQGARGVPLAEKCVRARSKMKSMFKRTIPLTKTAGSNAKRKRQKLLDLLRAAKRKQADAKRDKDRAKRGDNGPKRKWEDAKKKVRKIEKDLERFNRANGKNIQRNVDRLVRHYQDGRKKHETPERDDRNRLDNCKKLSRISY